MGKTLLPARFLRLRKNVQHLLLTTSLFLYGWAHFDLVSAGDARFTRSRLSFGRFCPAFPAFGAGARPLAGVSFRRRHDSRPLLRGVSHTRPHFRFDSFPGVLLRTHSVSLRPRTE